MKTAKTILIVEDVGPLRKAIATKLQHAGLHTLEAKDGVEGLAIALQHHPDLILLDILMPKMDGLTVLKRLRGDQWGRAVPVIILSNLVDEHYFDEAERHNVEDYVIKSNWKLEDIVQRIYQALQIEQHS